jgi:hypothetical protein
MLRVLAFRRLKTEPPEGFFWDWTAEFSIRESGSGCGGLDYIKIKFWDRDLGATSP